MYQSIGVRFSPITDMAIDGMHLVRNLCKHMKADLTKLVSTSKKKIIDGISDSRISLIAWPTGERRDVPWVPSCSGQWSGTYGNQ